MNAPANTRRAGPAAALAPMLVVSTCLSTAQAACGLEEELPGAYRNLVRADVHAAPVETSARSRYFDPTAAFHGQILLGEEPLFLYHLPMFMTDPGNHPHNFQVILEVEIPERAAAAAEALRADRAAHPDALYTAMPPVFAQRQLLDYPGHPHLGVLEPVRVVRHHFERATPPPVRVAEAPLAVREVVHLRQLAPGRDAPDELAYILFGRGEERYMAHLLSTPPDFDQLLKVRVDGTTDVASGPLYVTLAPRPNRIEDRLAAGEVVRCSGSGQMLRLAIEREIFCEAGELEVVDGEGPFRPRDCPAS